MMKRMQPIVMACDAPSLSDANGRGHARRFPWGSLYPAKGSEGDGAR